MDDLLLKVLSRLVGIHETFGRRVFEDAAHKALLGIGKATKDEAERAAGVNLRQQHRGSVVPFPLGDTRQKVSDESDGHGRH